MILRCCLKQQLVLYSCICSLSPAPHMTQLLLLWKLLEALVSFQRSNSCAMLGPDPSCIYIITCVKQKHELVKLVNASGAVFAIDLLLTCC